MNSLKIVTWNANSIRQKIKEFKNFLYTNNYDVAGVCETKTDGKFKLKIPGYKSYLRSRDNRGGGVAIFVKHNIKHEVVNLELTNVEFEGVKIFSETSKLIIGQVYKSPNKKLNLEELKILFAVNNIIVMGDLNCKRKEWMCPIDNADGSLLLDFCLKENIKISTPLQCTNFPTVGRPSVIDFFLIKSRLDHSLPVTKIGLSSDHNPVETFVTFHCVFSETPSIYDYSKADWPNFRKELNNCLNLNFHIKNSTDV